MTHNDLIESWVNGNRKDVAAHVAKMETCEVIAFTVLFVGQCGVEAAASLARLVGNTYVWDDSEVVEDHTPVRDHYEDGKCPGCGEEIPVKADDGDECDNCGHTFAREE